jgi:hypothetical protein
MGDSRCRTFDEAKNHGSASNANDNVRDGDCCSYQQVWIVCKEQINAWGRKFFGLLIKPFRLGFSTSKFINL